MNIYTHEREWNGGETAIAFGMFDGVHLGHRRLIETTCRAANEMGLSRVVFTFSNHPLSIIRPDCIPDQVDTRQEKLQDIAGCGPDAVILRPFDESFAGLSAEQFIDEIQKTMHPRVFVIGFNYTFGAKGLGKAEDMLRLGSRYGIETRIVDRVEIDGETVSSSRIRSALQEGNIALANTMLGRPYRIEGLVESGKHLGRTLGFPTANLSFPEGKLLPRYGVYGCMAHISGRQYPAAVNVGIHPTAPEGKPTIEAFLIDYPGASLYDSDLTLEFYYFIRPEKRFDSLEDLRDEVLRNCGQVAGLFSKKMNGSAE
ncbi:MAG: bifunctional riboflavin kinase/FAD synthetase [Clostridia bacterium]|nr:bifunctional riboflavin kinase/FAD synthetase [Clostridia bacterium]